MIDFNSSDRLDHFFSRNYSNNIMYAHTYRFCNPSQFANGTQVFAALFRQRNENGERTVYPMAWDLSNEAIPGEDRTAYYQYACNQC